MTSPGESPLTPAPQSPAGPSQPTWRWWVHLAILTGYPLALGLVGGLFSGSAVGPVLPETVSGMLGMVAAELALFGGLFGVAWAASRASPAQLWLRWRDGFWPILRGLGYSVALRLLVGIMMLLVLAGAMVFSGANEETVNQFRPRVEAVVSPESLKDNAYFWLSVTLISFVVAGLREELWRAGMLAGIRGAFPGRFETRPKQLVAVVLIAVVFGLGHIPQGWTGVLLTGCLGLGLGALIVYHRSIWDAVFAHGFFDAATFVLLRWLAFHFPDLLGGAPG